MAKKIYEGDPGDECPSVGGGLGYGSDKQPKTHYFQNLLESNDPERMRRFLVRILSDDEDLNSPKNSVPVNDTPLQRSIPIRRGGPAGPTM